MSSAGDPPAVPASAPIAESLGRLIARNTALNAAARMVSLTGWLLLTPWILHRLGPDRFGFWSVLGVLLGLYLTFDLGLSSALTKFVAEFHAAHDATSLCGTVTLGAGLYIGISILGVALVAAAQETLLDFFHIAASLRAEAGSSLIWAAVAYGVMNLWTMMGSVLAGLQRLDIWNRISIVSTALQLLGAWLVVNLGWGVRGLVLNTGFGMLVGLILSWWAVHRLAPEIHLSVSGCSRTLWKRLTNYSTALQIVNLGGLAQFQLEKVLYPRFLSLGAVASYELGYRVAFAAWSIPSVLLPPLLPAVSHLEASGDRERIVRLYTRASRYLLAVAMPLAAALAALAPVFYTLWLGPGHRDAARAAIALGALLWVNVLTGTGSLVARGMGRAWIEARYHLLSMALHLALSLVLIPRLGFIGGLWAMFLSGTVGTIYFLWSFHRMVGNPLAGHLRKVVVTPALASLLAAGLAWWVSGSAGISVDSWSRFQALRGLLAGSLVFVAVSAGVVIGSGYVSLAELRGLIGLLTGSRPDSGAITASPPAKQAGDHASRS